MHFGETLRKIRKNRCLTQKDLCQGIMKQATYSRIENGQLEISAELLPLIVERLNISLNEFLFIHQNYVSTPRQQLIKEYLNIVLTVPSELVRNKRKVEQYLAKQQDPDVELLLYSYDGMIALSGNDYTKMRHFSEKIWSKLQKLDQWYINDLELLNAIIIYFPLDTAKEITKTAIARMNAYDSYEKDLTYLKIYFQVNLTALFLEENKFEDGLQLLNSLHEVSKKHLTYQLLAVVLERKILCKHFLQQSYDDDLHNLHMLEQLFEDKEVFETIWNELEMSISKDVRPSR